MTDLLLRYFSSITSTAEEIMKELHPSPAALAEQQTAVDTIISQIRQHGDAAILELTRKFDWPDATLEALIVGEAEIRQAHENCSRELLTALEHAIANIRKYHQRQLPQDWFEEMAPGLQLGLRHTPLDSAACYVPTSRASLPSSLLMSVVPAQVAGVKRIVVMGPACHDGTLPNDVLAAAHLLGITEIYKLGGAVAMAALAIGSDIFPRVDKLVGPTNVYGMLAKKTLFGEVGIDGLYGPSDVAIISDGSAPPAWVATDMLSQAEHGEDSPAVLLTPDTSYARLVVQEIDSQISSSPRAEYLRKSLQKYGAIIITHDLQQAAEMCNLLAPEHLELSLANPQDLLPAIRHAGAIFLGTHTPVPVGDYYAGPSHVLPTNGTARFSSGLGVNDFLKRTSLLQSDAHWLRENSNDIILMAETESLSAHADAIRRRSCD